MENEKKQHYLAEDVRNLPSVMEGLKVEDLKADPTCCLSLQDRCEVCYRQGTNKPVHQDYVQLADRRNSFPARPQTGSSPLYLAETGLFFTGERFGTCFQCGQDILLLEGQDPLKTHADLFRNCKHVCKILGYTNRRPRSGTEMKSCPTSPSLTSRRRVFSE